jgi:hypothetical protein
LITLVVLVTLGLLTAGGFGFYALLSDDGSSPQRNSNEASESNVGKYAQLDDPDDLSEEDLDKIDRHALFLETLLNMMVQKTVRTKNETAFSRKEDFSDGFKEKSDVRFDYETKKLSFERENSFLQDTSPSESRCDNGKSYRYSTLEKSWQETRVGDCSDLNRSIFYIGDGVNIFGLNKEQADKVMAYFTDDYSNLIQVRKIGLKSGLNGNKKQYIRFVVDYMPIESGQYGYLGLQHLIWAFKRAEIEYSEHPYSPKGNGGQGLHVVYYVDPATGLPVYSQQSNIPPFDDNGKPRSVDESGIGYRDDRYQYYFDDEFPTLDPNTNEKITLEWERDEDAKWKPSE